MEITVKILKFDLLLKRRDIKKPTWFAVENDIFTHPDFFKINGEEFKCWFWIISIASKLSTDVVRLDPEVFAHQAQSSVDCFLNTIKKLKGKRLEYQEDHVHVTDAYVLRTDPCTTLHYTTLQDTTEQNTTQQNMTLHDKTEHYTTRQNRTEQNTTLHNTTSCDVAKIAPPPKAKRSKIEKFESIKEVIEAIPTDSRDIWKHLYSDPEFLQREALKAWNYYAVQNKEKMPKSSNGWNRALSRWFEKGWIDHVKGISSRRMTASELNSQSLTNMYNNLQKGEKDVTN